MDTSKDYIKMCESAEAIYKNPLQYHSGDYVYNKENWKVVILYYSKYHGNPPFKYLDNKLSIWLPRQDQLQEMVFKDRVCLHYQGRELIKDFYIFTHPEDGLEAMFIHSSINKTISKKCGYISQFTSMEQLWLAFVQKELYKKTWNGTDWVKD